MSEANMQNTTQSQTKSDSAAGSGLLSFFIELGEAKSDESYLVEQRSTATPDEEARDGLSVNVPIARIEPSSGASTWVSRRQTASAATLTAKRGIDIAASIVAITVLSPVMIVIAITLALRGGPILFAQERIGLGGKPFNCYKFRTMKVGANAMLSQVLAADPEFQAEWKISQKIAADPRVTRFGKFLRASSLDELPQLFNVLKSDMSLVGPRPILYEETVKYSGFLGYYLSARPGLTGLWQVSGRNDTTYPRRVALDVAYVRNISVGFDAMILLKTIPAIFKAQGAR